MTKETAMKILKELHGKSLFAERTALETLIPELKESEDERIKRFLIQMAQNGHGSSKEWWNKCVAWLEKQGEEQPIIRWHSISEEPEEMKELFCEWESDDATWHDVAFYDEESKTFRHAKMPINVTKWVYVDELLERQDEQKPTSDTRYEVGVGGSLSVNGEPFDYEHATITQNDFASVGETATIELSSPIDCGDRIYHVSHKPIEKSGEQKPVDKPISKDEILYQLVQNGTITAFDYLYLTQRCINTESPKDYHDIDPHLGIPVEDLMSRKNPVDKVKSKFKVGAFYTDGYNIYQVKAIGSDRYFVKSDEGIEGVLLFGSEDYYHLWTIQDAKDGDVLCWDESKCVALFKNVYDKESFNSYGFVGHCTGTFETGLSYHDIEGAHPATKEQRDLLFTKMEEAGYEFDFEKKELKKIEDEIEIPFGAKDSELQEETYFIPKGFHAEIKDDKVVIKKGEKSANWSDEDEENLNKVIGVIERRGMTSTVEQYKDILYTYICWLKSLKTRIGG